MSKNLVIVESPAKAKTIEKFLGKDFKVMSSYGHIRDLQKLSPRLCNSRRQKGISQAIESRSKKGRHRLARVR